MQENIQSNPIITILVYGTIVNHNSILLNYNDTPLSDTKYSDPFITLQSSSAVFS
jgi:hypothetical protein